MRTTRNFKLAVITILYITEDNNAKIMRNNALMTKMMSHFQKDNVLAGAGGGGGGEQDTEAAREEQQQPHQQHQPRQQPRHQKDQPQEVLTLMQNVLCRNFPSIPCNLIMKDATIRKLMERSVQQIAFKKLSLEKTTVAPGYDLTLFPMINSEDLSNFLQVSHTGYFNKERAKNGKKKKQGPPRTVKNFWSHEKIPRKKIKGTKESKRPELYTGRKKIRKFYPHKIKYKDKIAKGTKSDFRDYSDEKLSMSVEVPEMITSRKPNSQPLTYKVDGDGRSPPVWRIDYTKHGEPSLNMFAYEEDRLRGKIVRTGPDVIVDENVLERGARREVLHPDVYIKKTFNRKGAVNVNSEGSD